MADLESGSQEIPEPMNRYVEITIVMDEDLYECIYIDGNRDGNGAGDLNLYASEVVEATNGLPAALSHESIDFAHDQWPNTLEEALTPPGFLL